jgi:hypothetical protein
MTGKKVLIVLVVVLVGAAVVAANLWYRRDTGLRVAAEAIRTRDLEAIVSASGKIQPKRQVNVSANTTGGSPGWGRRGRARQGRMPISA